MTSAFRIYMQHKDGTGSPRDVVGHRFRITVDNTQFWFGVHEAHDTIGLYRITDLRSGRKVLDIPHHVLAANRGILPAAAKAAWKKFMSGRNEKSVRAVIEAAPALEETAA